MSIPPIPMESSVMRRNGFGRPFHPLQVVGWVVFGLDVCLFCVLAIPLVASIGGKVAVGTAYALSVFVLVLATARATKCDPVDPHVRGLQDLEDLKDGTSEALSFCSLCDSSVYNRSKHCGTCGKCVSAFDHHCMWLNNCVGEQNYRDFVVCICSVAVMTGIVLSVCVYLLIDYFVGEDNYERRFHDNPMFSDVPKEFSLGSLWLLVMINLPLFVLDMQLVILHAFLYSQQLTTYEYIMNKMDMREEKVSKKYMGDKARWWRANIRTLPHCMDWIIFARCGRRRRKRTSNQIKRIEAGEDTAPAPDVEALRRRSPKSPDRAQAASPSLRTGAEAHSAAAFRIDERKPSPPGFTDEASADPTSCIVAVAAQAAREADTSASAAGTPCAGGSPLALNSSGITLADDTAMFGGACGGPFGDPCIGTPVGFAGSGGGSEAPTVAPIAASPTLSAASPVPPGAAASPPTAPDGSPWSALHCEEQQSASEGPLPVAASENSSETAGVAARLGCGSALQANPAPEEAKV